MWPTLFFIIKIIVGSKKLLWSTVLGLFSVPTKTRWDIGFIVSILNMHNHISQQVHIQTSLLVPRFLKHNPSLGLWFSKGEDSSMHITQVT